MRDHDISSLTTHRIGPFLIRFHSHSDMGKVRKNNEDALIEAPQIGLFGVCDGLGGHAAGEVASAIASDTLAETLAHPEGNPAEALEHGVELANQRILRQQSDHPEQQGMGTTLSLLWIQSDTKSEADGLGWVAHVGDSRIYQWRRGALRQITSDHSPVFRLHQQGYLTKDQMRHHPQKNLLDRSLGISPTVEPDIFSISLRNRDRFLICTDGLSDALSDDEIASFLAAPDLDAASRSLVKAANEKGGLDNITIAVVDISEA